MTTATRMMAMELGEIAEVIKWMHSDGSRCGKGETGEIQRTIWNQVVGADSTRWAYVTEMLRRTLIDWGRSDRMRMIKMIGETLGTEIEMAINTTAFQLEHEGRLEINRASSSSNKDETLEEEAAQSRNAQEHEERWEKVETKKRGKGKADEPRKATEIITVHPFYHFRYFSRWNREK